MLCGWSKISRIVCAPGSAACQPWVSFSDSAASIGKASSSTLFQRMRFSPGLATLLWLQERARGERSVSAFWRMRSSSRQEGTIGTCDMFLRQFNRVFAVGAIQSVKHPQPAMHGSKLYPVAQVTANRMGLAKYLFQTDFASRFHLATQLLPPYVILVSIKRAGGTAGAHQFVRVAK
jgi:hypothetical protein